VSGGALAGWDRIVRVNLPAAPAPTDAVPADRRAAVLLAAQRAAGAAHAGPEARSARKRARDGGASAAGSSSASVTLASLAGPLSAAADEWARELTSAARVEDMDALRERPWAEAAAVRLDAVLARGLVAYGRASLVRVVPCWPGGADGWAAPHTSDWHWSLEEAPPAPSALWVMASLRAHAALRLVDRGPPEEADGRGAAAFRELWGPVAQLRRFGDGAIVDAVVWSEATPLFRRPEIVPRIVRHLAVRHLGAPTGAAPTRTPGLDVEAWGEAVAHRAAPGATARWASSADAAAAAARAALAALEAHMREAPGMPLTVARVAPVSAGLRATDDVSPAPHPLAGDDGGAARAWAEAATAAVGSSGAGADAGVEGLASQCLAPLHAIVTLESSSKWPDALGAVAATKIAFLLRLKHALRSRCSDGAVVCRVGVPLALRRRLRQTAARLEAKAADARGESAEEESGDSGGEDDEGVGQPPAALARDALLTVDDWVAAASGAGSPLGAWCPWLDVLFGGYAFRLWLFHNRELALLLRAGGRPAHAVVSSPALLASLGAALDDDELPRATTGVVNVGRITGAAPPVRAAVDGEDEDGAANDEGWVTVGAAALPTATSEFAASVGTSPVEAPPAGLARTRAAALFEACVLAPRHAASVAAFARAHVAFAATVRLACRWLARHGLLEAGHWRREAVELLVAQVFLEARPWLPPATPAAALVRWLDLMATHDWARGALLVDMDAACTADDFRTVAARLRAVRGAGPELRGTPAFVVTPVQRGLWRPPWTSAPHGPTWIAVRRTAWLARHARDALLADLATHLLPAAPDAAPASKRARAPQASAVPPPVPDSEPGASVLDVSLPLGDFDGWVTLAPRLLPREDGPTLGPSLARDGSAAAAVAAASVLRVSLFKNVVAASRSHLLVGHALFGAAALVADLRAAVGGRALFFADTRGAGAVAWAWRPRAFPVPPAQALAAAREALRAAAARTRDAGARVARVPADVAATLAAMRDTVTAIHRIARPVAQRIVVAGAPDVAHE
jgi:hypothetical protein